ncbi:MAG: isomerizing glutamine--fructose-6-phosphate transaminase [Pseudomonadales bacterium]|nr:isomerizing glutamine--fructose-6-phosphate transaminase [Pseudomonadales bacterium]
MCGIVACSSAGADVSQLVSSALQKLEYRGYDSYGFGYLLAGAAGSSLASLRRLDPLTDMQDLLPATPVAIGHTRWATHGAVVLENCHPHQSPDGTFTLVHNGIVENYQLLAQQAGIDASELLHSDTAVLTHRFSQLLQQTGDRRTALQTLLGLIEGRNTIVVLFEDGEILGFRDGSPLVIGRSPGHVYMASDVLAFGDWSDQSFAMENHQIISIQGETVRLYDDRGALLVPDWQTVDARLTSESPDPGGYHMLQEIMVQWETIPRQAQTDPDALARFISHLHSETTVIVTGAGGAYYAARQICWMLRELAGIRAIEIPAYEIGVARQLVRPGDVLLAISQSGETADTLDAIEAARSWGMTVACLVNMPLCSMSRLADHVFYNRCGPEICVLSTKSATAQIAFGYLLAQSYRGTAITGSMDLLSRELTRYLSDPTHDRIRRLAASLVKAEHLYILGAHENYGAALISALNIKEASYLHAEAFAAGELKHGVIALIEEETPVLVFVPGGDTWMLAVAAEVRARGARVIGLADDDNELFDDWLPLPATGGQRELGAIANIIPCQLLAFELAVQRGLNPDKPRNLAKSVTVR